MPSQKELNEKYGNNLSVTSNDPQIIQRDQSGNISPESSKTVYIEPTVWKYDTDSINQIINTNFSYYTFPPKLIIDDAEVPDVEGLADLGIKFNSRYRAEPQPVPTIELLLPDKFDINYGWNDVTTTELILFDTEKAKELGMKPIKFLKDGRQIDPKPTDSDAADASKYYRAQLNARTELDLGTSTGRYRTMQGPSGKDFSDWFDRTSLFEGHFRKIKFTEIIDGMPQTIPGSFKVNQDLIDSKKSLQFNIQVAVSHPDNHGRNTFAIRLIRNRANANVNEPYEPLKMVSSMEQGAFAVQDQSGKKQEIANLALAKDELQQLVLANEAKLQALEQIAGQLRTRYNEKEKLYAAALIALALAPFLPVLIASARYTYNQFKAARDMWKQFDNQVNALRAYLPTLITAANNKATEYKNAVGDSQIDPKSPEAILNSQYTYLYTGQTYFNLNYILNANDMQLNDIYSIEMLASKAQEYEHELIEDNTYWDIKEITDSEIYELNQAQLAAIAAKDAEAAIKLKQSQEAAAAVKVILDKALDTFKNKTKTPTAAEQAAAQAAQQAATQAAIAKVTAAISKIKKK